MSSSGLAREEFPATSQVVTDFTDTILSADEAAPGAFVRALLRDGMSPGALLEQVFAPAARILGQRWETDECSFYEVTLASGHIQRLVRAISPLPVRPCRFRDDGPDAPDLRPRGTTHPRHTG